MSEREKGKEAAKESQDDIDRELENAQWLRFAEAAIRGRDYATIKNGQNTVADFADAMLEEAKKRGRL